MEERTNDSNNYTKKYLFESDNASSKSYFDLAPTGSTGINQTIPFKINVLKNVSERAKSISNSEVKKQVDEFLTIFTQVIASRKDELVEREDLPAVNLAELDDKSILLEWGSKDFKIGFSFEPKKSDSGWFLVSGKNLDGDQQGGSLKKENFSDLIEYAINYVSANT